MDTLSVVSPASATEGAPESVPVEVVVERDGQGTKVSIIVLAVLAVMYTLYIARPFLLPIVFAVLLNFLFSPFIRGMEKLHIPRPLASAVIVLSLLGLLGLGGYELAGPVQSWADKAPQTLAITQQKLRGILRPIQRVTKSAEQAQSAASAASGGTKAPEVIVSTSSMASRVLDSAKVFVAALLEVFILLYFLLSVGDLFLQKLIRVVPSLHDKKKAVRIARETQASISTYLVTVTTINIVEGMVVAGVMYLLGMPNVILWGTLVAMLEFIPYIGSLALVAIFTVAGLTTFDNVGHAALVPLSFLVINILQANVLSPMLHGHRLALNPVALFIGLAFWFWIWGIPGAFIGVPLVATLRICCDHIESLAGFGEFLGERHDPEKQGTTA